MQITKQTLDDCFIHHAPTPAQRDAYDDINLKTKELARLCLNLCPPSRELSLALTAIQEARMWANASIAINPVVEKTPAQDAISQLQDPRSGGGKAVIDLSNESNPGEPFIKHIARVCHEVNRAYCTALGDTSQVAWDDAPDWQRKSAVNGVEQIQRDPATPPWRSHEGWLKEKQEAGWMYGPMKDQVLKTHPCIVPYDDLPVEQKAKDHIFGAVVRALL